MAEEKSARNKGNDDFQLLKIPGGYARLAVVASLGVIIVMTLIGDGTPDSYGARYLLIAAAYTTALVAIDRWGNANEASTYWFLVARLNIPFVRNLGLFILFIHVASEGGFFRANLLVKAVFILFVMFNASEVFLRLKGMRTRSEQAVITSDGALLDLLMAILLCAIYLLNGFGEIWGKVAAYSCVCIWIGNLAASLRRFHFSIGAKVYSSWKPLLMCFPIIWGSFALAFFGFDYLNSQIITAFVAVQGLWFLLVARFAKMPY
ncbi:MAG: hypothetical protein LBT59_27075 [Clostridiales bacterium]|nr:hypothetical protein [Clostridiales bacterium]